MSCNPARVQLRKYPQLARSKEVVQSYFAQLRNISRFRSLSETVVDVTLCRKLAFGVGANNCGGPWAIPNEVRPNLIHQLLTPG